MAEEEYVLYGPKDDSPLPGIPLGHFLLQRLRQHGDSIAQMYPDSDETYTFADILARAVSVSEELKTRELGVGEVVAVVSRIASDFAPLLLGGLLSGAVIAPLNPAFDYSDMKSMLSLLEPRLVFCDPDAADTVGEVLPHLDSHPDLILLDGGPAWSKFFGRAPNPDFRPVDIPDFWNREAAIMCSSGTTGLSKGVILTHKGILAQINIFENADETFRDDDIMLQFSPNFWISGLFLQVIAMVKGIKLVVMSSYDVEKFLRTVQEYKISMTFLGPNQALEVGKSPALGRYDVSTLRNVTCGGAAMSSETQAMVEAALNREINQWYGMTEILLALGSGPGERVNEGSSGRLQPNVVAKVLDGVTGKLLGPGQRGEMCLKGPGLTKGYYRNPEATAAAIDEQGWLHTGDVAYYDEDGCFYVVDRIKDLIKYRGHHVAPVEIESLLLEHPGVKDVAVVGVKHDLDQEHPLAVVVRQPGKEVSEQELVHLVSSNLAEHKWLRAGVRFVESIPKTTTGKTQRRILRDQLQQQQLRNELRTSA